MIIMLKNIEFYTANREKVKIIVELRNDDHGHRELSIVGEITNERRYGQCYQAIRELVEQHGSGSRNKDQILKLLDIWERWHLNDMRAGTPRQTEIIRPWLKRNPNKDYTEQCDYLFSHGMLIDDGYKYGTAWLYEPLPDDVITFISGL